MPTKTDWVQYDDHRGYLAWPERATAPLPAVLVIQEVWGVDAHIQDVTRRLASAGYAAFAPDLHEVNGQRPNVLSADRVEDVKNFMDSLPTAARMDPALRNAELAKLPESVRVLLDETHKALFSGIGRLDRFLPALMAAVRYLQKSCPASAGQKVACVGFCMGGGLSALLACEDSNLAGAAIFYGSSPPAELVPKVTCPVIGFYGGLDQRVNAGIPAFTEAMKAAGKSFEQLTYEGAQHGFFNDTRASYNVRAARDSFVRFLDFLQRTTCA